jgi:hypothetical protein
MEMRVAIVESNSSQTDQTGGRKPIDVCAEDFSTQDLLIR